MARDLTRIGERARGSALIKKSKSQVKPITIRSEPFKAGDNVQAHEPAYGYRPASIVRVVQPGLLYIVKVDGSTIEKEMFFSELLRKL